MKVQNILYYLFLAVITTLPFAGWHFFMLGMPIYAPELIVILASAVFIWMQYHTDGLKVKKLPAPIFIAIAMMCFGLISSAIFNGITTVQLGIIKSWFFFPMLFAWLVFQVSHQRKNRTTIQTVDTFSFTQKTLLVWYAMLVITALVALVYFFQGNLTYDGRLRAFYLSPNYLALFLFPGVFLGWHFIIKTCSKNGVIPHQVRDDKNYGFLFILTVLSWLILCVAIYLTLSYTVITASIFGFFTTLFLQSKRSYFSRISIVALCISIISFFLLFQMHGQKFSDIVHNSSRSSLASRIMIWQASAKMLADRPIFGIGPGNFQSTYLDYQKYFPPYLEWAVPHPHNLYLAFWLQTGLIGLLSFLLLIIIWTRNILRKMSMDTKKASLEWTLLGIVMTLLLVGLLDTPYWKNDLAYSFWLLIALGL